MKEIGKWLSVNILFPLLAVPDDGDAAVEFGLGGFGVGVEDGRDLLEVEDFEDGTTFSVVVVVLLAPFSVLVFVFGVGGGVVAAISLVSPGTCPFEGTSSPPAMRSEEASRITSNANILGKVMKVLIITLYDQAHAQMLLQELDCSSIFKSFHRICRQCTALRSLTSC